MAALPKKNQKNRPKKYDRPESREKETKNE